MELFPAGIVAVLLWVWALLRTPDRGVLLAVLLLPFGMLAVAVLHGLGGLSLLAAHVVAGLASIALLPAVLRDVARHGFRPARAAPSIFLFLFALYGSVAALLFVRFFAGSFLVFPLSRDAVGVAVSPSFPSTMSPLAPTSANLSQTFYVWLAAVFFVVARHAFSRFGLGRVDRALWWAAMLNAGLGLLDFLALDQWLAPVRTATYSLANTQVIAGFERVIGGFPEPSSFGTASAVFMAYFASAYGMGGRGRDAVAALLSLAAALSSVSATALAAVALVWAILGVRAIGALLRGGAGTTAILRHGTLLALMVAAISLALALTPLDRVVAETFRDLVLSKPESLSGLERKAWAVSGFRTFVETYGLGAGLGSIRSNGLLPVLLGSVGLPGTLLFAGFVWTSLAGSARGLSGLRRRVLLGARLGALAQLAAMFTSGTTPDPGLFLVTMAAMASVAAGRV